MSGGTLVWLTDDDLELILDWEYDATLNYGEGVEDIRLREKLQGFRDEIACKVPGPGRTLARDA